MSQTALSVLDHAPHDWYLLRAGEDYFLDVNCSASWLGYSLLIRLDAAERAAVLDGGHAACNALAEHVRFTATPSHPRDLSREYDDAVRDAIARWRAAAEA
ncbi:hypothetical protein JR065_03460 [Xanthomonas sp. AmX2]|uniref:hypothetical protein n=1 Tax=Xanthomonas sp. TaxID=29446 RepID=UPI00197FB6BC|nr:hypothetical protein [Xanthomonas sp.]MBN6149383.1 hypothetical protein [Xanthomonas sp.]